MKRKINLLKITECNYYFFHHYVMSKKDRNEIIRTIRQKDFDGFFLLFKKYNSKEVNPDGWCFFPLTFTIYTTFGSRNGNILNREDFNCIKYAECECG